jgi:hypothetical protein
VPSVVWCPVQCIAPGGPRCLLCFDLSFLCCLVAFVLFVTALWPPRNSCTERHQIGTVPLLIQLVEVFLLARRRLMSVESQAEVHLPERRPPDDWSPSKLGTLHLSVGLRSLNPSSCAADDHSRLFRPAASKKPPPDCMSLDV